MKPSKLFLGIFLALLAVASVCVVGYGQAAGIRGSTVDAGTVTPGVNPGISRFGVLGTSFTNLRHGISGAMTAGAVTVSDAGATANTRYFFTTHTLGTVTVCSTYYASTRTPGVSFVITSNQPTDTSTVDWVAIEP